MQPFLQQLLAGQTVEWKPLGDLAVIKTGQAVSKQMISDNSGQYPVINSGREPLGFIDTWNTDNDPIGITTRGAGVGSITWQEGRYYRGNLNYSVTIKDNLQLNVRYLYHVLLQFQHEIHALCSFSGIPALNASELKKLYIPIPPLSVQTKIAQILDTFTAITAELTAELNIRNQQYQYYRDKLLSVDELAKVGFEWKTLGEICHYVDYRGKTPNKAESGIYLVTAKNIKKGFIDYEASKEYVLESEYQEVMRRGLPKLGDVLITTEAPCGHVAQVDREDIALAQRVIKYCSKNPNVLSNDFLKFVLLGKYFQNELSKYATGGTVKGIKGSVLHKIEIPIPPLSEQVRIVAILDKFETLTQPITEGLPREIELRQKQYAYYRERLLGFSRI
ncbi:restriction endonuclease subunit S [uncultured Moraxella sp.]|uniref:restriction endonuclease subunit S n=1 Tax=uncultured Moraxella sp. TaxID=263769 RepID=UPI0025FF61D1|nr:restriction endonuclease subunit S [uncultured Moraxella sp.]